MFFSPSEILIIAVQSGKCKWDGDELNGWLHHEGVSKFEHRASRFTFPPDIHSATTKNFHIASQLNALWLVKKERGDIDVVRLIYKYWQDIECLETKILQELIEVHVSHSENKDVKGRG